MKRLFVVLFLSGLFMHMQAVNITVVRVTNEIKEVETVSSMRFLPGQTIQFTLASGESTEVTGVRKISFENNDFTAIEDVTTPSTIRVYPNPTADMLIIDGVTAQQEIAIYSLNGAKVLSSQSQEGTNTLHVSDLPNGVYLLKLANETFKLIKE
jgi:hypothetical protein